MLSLPAGGSCIAPEPEYSSVRLVRLECETPIDSSSLKTLGLLPCLTALDLASACRHLGPCICPAVQGIFATSLHCSDAAASFPGTCRLLGRLLS